jgi:EpsI family protein
MVPVGEALIPYLIDFTADFTIYLLRQTGLSVYREGNHFSLVSGDWSVVEACSGLRYLLASFTLGTIYAYITYQQLYKRLLFMLFSLILPIIANGLRAYMIVMIGHLSGMKLAVGVDHLVYGAVFFGLIIFLMFYIGSFFRDPPPKSVSSSTHSTATVTNPSFNQQAWLFLILLVCVSIWPLSNALIQANYHVATHTPAITLNNSSWSEHTLPTKQSDWRPSFKGAVTESLQYYQNQNNIIGYYQANFGNEKQGAELVNSQNLLIPNHLQNKWRIVKQSNITIPQLGLTVDAIVLKSRQENSILLFKWYQVGNRATNSPYLAKIFQLVKKLTFNSSPETYNILFTYSSKLNALDDVEMLKSFLIETSQKH